MMQEMTRHPRHLGMELVEHKLHLQPVAPDLLGGAFGIGANPSLKVLMLGNQHSDQGIVNYALKEKETPGYGQDAWWEACPLAARDSRPDYCR